MSNVDYSPERFSDIPRPLIERSRVVGVALNLLANAVPEGPIDEVRRNDAFTPQEAVTGVEKAAVDYINAISQEAATPTVEKKVAGFVVESEANNLEEAQNKVKEAFLHDN